jgi:hypothetical protein
MWGDEDDDYSDRGAGLGWQQQQTQSAAYRGMLSSGGGWDGDGNASVFDMDKQDEEMYNDSYGNQWSNADDAYAATTGGSPPGETGGDDYLSTGDDAYKRKRRRRFFCIGLLLLMIGGLVATLAIVFSNQNKDEGGNSKNNLGVNDQDRENVGGLPTSKPTEHGDDHVQNDGNDNGGDNGGGGESFFFAPTISPQSTASDTLWDGVGVGTGDKGNDGGGDTAAPTTMLGGEVEPTVMNSGPTSAPEPVVGPTSTGGEPVDKGDSSVGDGDGEGATSSPTTAGQINGGTTFGPTFRVQENIFDESPNPTSSAPGEGDDSPVSEAPSITDDEGGANGPGSAATAVPSVSQGGDENGGNSDVASEPSMQPTSSESSISPTDLRTVTPGAPSISPTTATPTTPKPSMSQNATDDMDDNTGDNNDDNNDDGSGSENNTGTPNPTTLLPSNASVTIPPTATPGVSSRSPISVVPTTRQPVLDSTNFPSVTLGNATNNSTTPPPTFGPNTELVDNGGDGDSNSSVVTDGLDPGQSDGGDTNKVIQDQPSEPPTSASSPVFQPTEVAGGNSSTLTPSPQTLDAKNDGAGKNEANSI